MTMDPYFALFNCHVNNARQRANAAFIEKFGQPTFDRIMKPLHRNGIMSIFDTPPNEHTEFYVSTVHAIVNENAPKATEGGVS